MASATWPRCASNLCSFDILMRILFSSGFESWGRWMASFNVQMKQAILLVNRVFVSVMHGASEERLHLRTWVSIVSSPSTSFSYRGWSRQEIPVIPRSSASVFFFFFLSFLHQNQGIWSFRSWYWTELRAILPNLTIWAWSDSWIVLTFTVKSFSDPCSSESASQLRSPRHLPSFLRRKKLVPRSPVCSDPGAFVRKPSENLHTRPSVSGPVIFWFLRVENTVLVLSVKLADPAVAADSPHRPHKGSNKFTQLINSAVSSLDHRPAMRTSSEGKMADGKAVLISRKVQKQASRAKEKVSLSKTSKAWTPPLLDQAHLGKISRDIKDFKSEVERNDVEKAKTNVCPRVCQKKSSWTMDSKMKQMFINLWKDSGFSG